jgi:hypothetical protein
MILFFRTQLLHFFVTKRLTFFRLLATTMSPFELTFFDSILALFAI